jgi:tetratricopeptide (TPR) repeat protein
MLREETPAPREVLAAAARALPAASAEGYAARYEYARLLLGAGERAAAREQFLAAYAAVLEAGMLPLIDADFCRAMQEGWRPLVRRTAGRLQHEQRWWQLLALGRQCWELDEPQLADELLAPLDVYPGDHAPAEERLLLALALVEDLWTTGRLERADRVLRNLLAEPAFAGRAWLWRLGLQLAVLRKQPARELVCLERVVDLRYARPAEDLPLQSLRNDFEMLMTRYERQARALATLQEAVPDDVVERVVRAADRWRSLDADGSAACRWAGRILRLLGRADLAWEYLSTAIALGTREPDTWAKLGDMLADEDGDRDLAERAYRAATEADPQHVPFLYARALNLEEAGRRLEAHRLFRQVAEGKWSEEFEWLQAQAREKLQER